jgi:hypothetical protein
MVGSAMCWLRDRESVDLISVSERGHLGKRISPAVQLDSSKIGGAVANQFEIEIGRIDKSNLRGLAAQWCGNDLNLEIG